jgi:hypothetical protein
LTKRKWTALPLPISFKKDVKIGFVSNPGQFNESLSLLFKGKALSPWRIFIPPALSGRL